MSSLLFDRIFWCDIRDVSDSDKNLRIYGDKEGKKIYLEQGSAIIEIDTSTQAYLINVLVKKLTMDLTELIKQGKDVTTNI